MNMVWLWMKEIHWVKVPLMENLLCVFFAVLNKKKRKKRTPVDCGGSYYLWKMLCSLPSDKECLINLIILSALCVWGFVCFLKLEMVISRRKFGVLSTWFNLSTWNIRNFWCKFTNLRFWDLTKRVIKAVFGLIKIQYSKIFFWY